MFELSLKGFGPLEDLKIKSDNGIFIVAGDDGMGLDTFIKSLHIIGRIMTNMSIGSLFGAFEPNSAPNNEIEFSITHDNFRYYVLLVKDTNDYIVELEEISKGNETIFSHKRTECNLGKTVDKDALEWKRLRHTENDFPLLEQMQVRAMEYEGLSDFLWHDYGPLCNWAARNELKDRLFRSGKDYIHEIDKYLHWLTNDYSGLEHYIDKVSGHDSYTIYEHSSKRKVFQNSTKLLGMINMLYCLLNNAKVIWHPETVINNQRINDFYNVLMEFAADKPIFIVTDSPEFRRENSILYFMNRGNSVVGSMLK